jgi:hypothetical protein
MTSETNHLKMMIILLDNTNGWHDTTTQLQRLYQD